MGLNTTNAGAIVPGAGSSKHTRVVEMLKGTHVSSVGRDVKAGETVEVDLKDYNFLKPYGFCVDSTGTPVEAPAEEEVVEDEGAEEVEEEVSEPDDTPDTIEEVVEDFVEQVAEVTGKRKRR